MTITLQVKSIDAWREPDGGWYYNDLYTIGEIEVEDITDDQPEAKLIGNIWKALRQSEIMNLRSNRHGPGKGVQGVKIRPSYDNAWEILRRRTDEPLYELSIANSDDER